MVTREQVWNWLYDVSDPEIPVLSIIDLGVVREVKIENDSCQVTITPTYSGCPAMKTIEDDIIAKLNQEGLNEVKVNLVLSPAWTTDWISEEGRDKLRAYGIAPPENEVDKSVLFAEPPTVPCPLCSSKNTRMISLFGSTACKAQYQCNDCLEPFDYFKCLK
ncbi:MAG: phenylacetate-CoA oxygenase subunit PaaJ [Cryomorphaceae bacterium]|jgi:ring-1,2-phenylacetyl-CoA epoxidase subunit PaaD|nr:phenylacetate-CoA oxygenase subunit PaaJ [Cryomorphaceae bacterium]